MTYLSSSPTKLLPFILLLLLGITLSGCKPAKPFMEGTATEADAVFTKIQSLTATELDALGEKNVLPTQWVFPNAHYAQYTAPARFLQYKNAGEIVRFIQNNPNLLLFADEFSEMEIMISSNRFALVPLLDPQTGQVVQPRSPFPCSAVYIKKTRPLDQEKMTSEIFSGAEKEKITKEKWDGKEVLAFEQSMQLPVDQEQKLFARIEGITTILYFPTPDSAVFAIGPKNEVTAFLASTEGDQRGVLAQAMGRLDASHLDFAFLYHYDHPFVQLTPSQFPPPFGPALEEDSKYVLLTMDAGSEQTKNGVKMTLAGKTKDSAARIQTSLGSLLMAMAEQATQVENLPPGVVIPPYAKKLDGIIKQIKIELNESNMIATLPGSDDVSELFDEVFKEMNLQMEKAVTLQQTNIVAEQLYAMGRLMTSYYSKHNSFPPLSINDSLGKPLLSWRVALLPAFGPEGEALYQQFKLDEPWNGANNIKLLERIPALYASQTDATLKTKTTFQIFNSPDTPFGKNPQGTKIQDIPNPSRTLMVVSIQPEFAVEWTQPENLPLDKDKLTKLFGRSVVALPVMGDVFRASFSGEPKGIEKLADLILGVVTEEPVKELVEESAKETEKEPE